MKKLLLLLVIAGMYFHTQAQTDSEQAIRKILAAQSNAWNRGSLHGFMEGYWQNDSLMFIGKSGITYGWKNTLENYQKNYSDPEKMGKLQFDIIKIEKLSNQYQSVTGAWHLQRTIGNLNGYFTLLFQQIKGKWYIIQDHSS